MNKAQVPNSISFIFGEESVNIVGLKVNSRIIPLRDCFNTTRLFHMVTKIYMLRDKQIDYYRKRRNDVDILRHRGHTPIPYRD